MSSIVSNLANSLYKVLKTANAPRNTVISGKVDGRTGLSPFLIRDRYSENLCYGGTAISSGDYLGRPKENAFDDSASTYWTSVYGTVFSSIYIGYDLISSREIRKITITTSPSGYFTPTIKIQRSSDNVNWSDVALISGIVSGKNVLTIASSGSSRYWRVLCQGTSLINGATDYNNNSCTVFEITMHELINSAMSDNEIAVHGNALITFPAGIGLAEKTPLDYIEAIVNDVPSACILTGAGTDTVPIAYTEDLCNGGTAISGGDYSGYPASNAFNKDGISSSWQSSQVTPNLLGAAWIGYNFGSQKAIRRIKEVTNNTNGYNVTSLKVQYSDNGTNWTDANIQTVTYGTNYISVPAVGAHQYWRLLANSAGRIDGTTNNCWIIGEIEMYEALQTHYIYADRNATTGAVTFGSTKQKPRTSNTANIFRTVLGKADVYTDNLCVDGAAISSGDLPGGWAKEYAFNQSLVDLNYWSSLQTGSALNGAYIGYYFGVARHIRRIIIRGNDNLPGSIKVQRSDNNTTWYDVLSIATIVIGNRTINLPVSQASQYWRILGTSASGINTASGWDVIEITMHELASELHYYDTSTNTLSIYDGTNWVDKQRVFVGEATVDSAGKIVSYKSYPYGITKFLQVDDLRLSNQATESGQPVRLDQFIGSVGSNGYIKIPVNEFPFPLIVQWGQFGDSSWVAKTARTLSFSVSFPNQCMQMVGTPGNTASNDAFPTLVSMKASSFSVAFNLSGGNTLRWIAIGY